MEDHVQPAFTEYPHNPSSKAILTTVIGEATGFQGQVIPPQLFVKITGKELKSFTLSKDTISIGRDVTAHFIFPPALRPDMVIADDHPFVSRELPQSHWSSGMQTLCRDSDLRAEP